MKEPIQQLIDFMDGKQEVIDLKTIIFSLEMQAIEKALREYNKSQASEVLNINRTTIIEKVRRWEQYQNSVNETRKAIRQHVIQGGIVQYPVLPMV